MKYEGNILKMRTELETPVRYFLPVGSTEVFMNELIGQKISLRFSGRINCISCGKRIQKSFHQGFCFQCLQTVPEASESVVRPELSLSHFGIARDMEWAEKHDLIEHVVYLAHTSDIKVGVTRHHQIPVRWIDQGATHAIKLAQTPNRHIAGVMEVLLKKDFTDRTNWMAMLKSPGNKKSDLVEAKKRVIQTLPAELKKYISRDDQVTSIEYPLNDLTSKIKSTGFDKTPEISGILKGIKGQYLVFENSRVLNVRKHNGYFIQLESPV